MASYSFDRAFTDLVHRNIALPNIYAPLNWQPYLLDATKAKEIDMFKGIDYVFTHEGTYKTVQERFREQKYQQYSDFTIRYRRDDNPIADRHASEYYKMKAHYFVYGIINSSKEQVAHCTDFIKYAVIDLQKVYEQIDNGNIVIANNGKHFCQIQDDKMVCPIEYNTDGSSSFFPIDIHLLVKLWGDDMLLAQKGFLLQKNDSNFHI